MCAVLDSGLAGGARQCDPCALPVRFLPELDALPVSAAPLSRRPLRVRSWGLLSSVRAALLWSAIQSSGLGSSFWHLHCVVVLSRELQAALAEKTAECERLKRDANAGSQLSENPRTAGDGSDWKGFATVHSPNPQDQGSGASRKDLQDKLGLRSSVIAQI
jgi:hypothetical protein